MPDKKEGDLPPPGDEKILLDQVDEDGAAGGNERDLREQNQQLQEELRAVKKQLEDAQLNLPRRQSQLDERERMLYEEMLSKERLNKMSELVNNVSAIRLRHEQQVDDMNRRIDPEIDVLPTTIPLQIPGQNREYSADRFLFSSRASNSAQLPLRTAQHTENQASHALPVSVSAFGSQSSANLPLNGHNGAVPRTTRTAPDSRAFAVTLPRKAAHLSPLPIFNGSGWGLFKKVYEHSTIIYGYDDYHNSIRLRDSLSGDALGRVSGLISDPFAATQIMEALDEYYGSDTQMLKEFLEPLLDLAHVRENDAAGFLEFSRVVNNTVALLENNGGSQRLRDQTLLEATVRKLPLSDRVKWSKHFVEVLGEVADVRLFAKWAKLQCKYLRMAQITGPTSNGPISANPPVERFHSQPRNPQWTQPVHNRAPPSPPRYNSRHVNTITVARPENVHESCPQCGHPAHALSQCSDFDKLTVAQRWAIVKSLPCCFSCLRRFHTTKECPTKRYCGINNCRMPHHRLLHESSVSTPPLPMPPSVTTSNFFIQHGTHCLYKYIPITVSGPQGVANVWAFLDDGSKASLIKESLAQEIGLVGPKCRIDLKWFTGESASHESNQVCLTIGPYNAKGLFTVENLKLPPQSFDATALRSRYPDLTDVELVSYGNITPRVLLGIPNANLSRPLNAFAVGDDFSLVQTRLGWMVYGGTPNDHDLSVYHVEVTDVCALDSDVKCAITDFFNLDMIVLSSPDGLVPTEEDKRALEILQRTTKKVGCRYQTGLLWKTDNPILPDSYKQALVRLNSVQNKFAEDDQLREWYQGKIEEYVAKGYAYKMCPERIAHPHGPTLYLPHFVVANREGKRRLVFDAAAKTKGESLNCHLLAGPRNLQPRSLLHILLHFRQSRVGVRADIREMFHRIRIIDKDQDALRFLWRTTSPNSNWRLSQPEVYTMDAMIFGARSSPCSSQYVKNIHARNFIAEFPRAVEAIEKFHYVDDYVDSFNTESEATAICQQVVAIHQQGGFELRGFVSNSSSLLAHLKESCVEVDTDLSPEKNKVLGLFWDHATDQLKFKLDMARIDKYLHEKPTKSEVLSLVMSVLDPFGFLANVSVRSRLIMQKLWSEGSRWTDIIGDELFLAWKDWLDAIVTAAKVNIPRCPNIALTDSKSDIQLHIFTDASSVAYAAVAYWRIQSTAGVSVHFIIGKCRCVPKVRPTIPRLELQAAVLGAQIGAIIRDAHTVQPAATFYWTDSKTVYHWFNSPSKETCDDQYNRLYTIQHCQAVRWNWVPGVENPADTATRAESKDYLWLRGPQFLNQDPEHWPSLATQPVCLPVCAIEVLKEPEDELLDIERFSSFLREG